MSQGWRCSAALKPSEQDSVLPRREKSLCTLLGGHGRWNLEAPELEESSANAR